MTPARTMVNISNGNRHDVDEMVDLSKLDKNMPLEMNGGSSGGEVRRKVGVRSATNVDVEEGRRKRNHARGVVFHWVVVLSIVAMSMVTLIALFRVHPEYLMSKKQFLTSIRHWLKVYQRLLRRRPLASRAVTAGVIFFLADFSAQKLKGEAFSSDRLLRYSSFGFFFIGPFLYLWYSLTLRYGPPDTLIGSIEKALFEQVTMEPVCILGFIIFDGIISRKAPSAILKRCRAEYWGLWCKNAIFWIPCNFANYYLGTPALRVIFANSCSFFWNVYFSSIVNRVAPKLGKNKPVRLESGENHKL